MIKKLLLGSLVSLIVSVVAGFIFVPIFRKIKAGQTILKYVKSHESKNGTPTMGGLFFILSAATVFIFFGGYENQTAVVALSLGLFYMTVGFLDDFLKIKLSRNEGLKPYQKIIFQTAVSLIAGIYAYNNGLTLFYIPFVKTFIDIGMWIIPISVLTLIAVTNSVNLTDGLDGLAGGTSLFYFICLIALIFVEDAAFGYDYLKSQEREFLILLSFCLTGAIAGFLLFNVNRAKVFMGDTGSLSLGGFIGAISLFSGNGLFIPVIGIIFVMSSLSVIIQVLHFKRTKRRVFLMAPIHHHFQMQGKTETQISYAYSLITVITGVISLIFYL